MPDLAKIEAVAAKIGPSEGADPASETTAAPPAGGPLGAGSAPADGDASSPSGDGSASDPSPGATIDHAEIERKLAADRERRAEKARRREAEEQRAAAKKQADEDREAAKKEREEAEKWKRMSWKERAQAEGKDPRAVWEEMRDEALKAGTPEARFEAMEKAWNARHEALAAELKAEREAREAERSAREEERKQTHAALQERAFVDDFQRTVQEADYESLREEYDDAYIFRVVKAQRDNPKAFLKTARDLGVRLEWEQKLAAGHDLTDDERGFTMVDILNVLRETQKRHFARIEEQRRKKTAAPQTATGAPAKKAPVASRPTVNGTAERNAGSLGNNLAATTAAGGSKPKYSSREEKVKAVGEKYG